MDTDLRFYMGISGGVIAVQGYCKDLVDRRSRSCPPMVKDGGSCIWHIRFNVKRGTFENFEANGSA